MSHTKMYQALEQGRERSDRDSSMPYNLEQHLCMQNWKKTPSHQIQSKKEEKEQPVCQPATLSIFLICPSLVTLTPLKTKGWKHTVLTDMFWVWILALLAYSVLANFILLTSHWLCLALGLQNIFPLHTYFHKAIDRRKFGSWRSLISAMKSGLNQLLCIQTL